MFYDCVVNNPQIAEQAKAVLDDWQTEHAGYYARHTIRRPYKAQPMHEATCGYRDIPGGGSWLTSGGNFHAIAIDDNTTRITYSGRRHGMRPEFRDLLEAAASRSDYITLSYRTHEPSWLPWETRDDYPGLAPMGLDEDPGTTPEEHALAAMALKKAALARAELDLLGVQPAPLGDIDSPPGIEASDACYHLVEGIHLVAGAEGFMLASVGAEEFATTVKQVAALAPHLLDPFTVSLIVGGFDA